MAKFTRAVARKQREGREGMMEQVVFPCDVEELLAYFEVEKAEELYFADDIGNFSIGQFNYLMRSADDRMEYMTEQIEQTILFLKKQMEANPGWKGTREEIGLSKENRMIWYLFLKDEYRPSVPNVKVWEYRKALTVAMARDDIAN